MNIREYHEELYEVCVKLDFDEFKEFFTKYGAMFHLFNDNHPYPTDEVIELTMYKVAYNHPDTPMSVKKAAKDWLKSHNFKESL